MVHDITIDAAPTTTPCPKCSGTGRCRTTLPGGWLVKKCGPCSGSGLVDAATAAPGDVDGPCCDPAEGVEPCRACLPPDLVPDDSPYIPSPEDEEARLAWVRDYDDRILTERIAADEPGPSPEPRTFVQKLYERGNHYRDMHDTDLAWLGDQIIKLAEQARWLDAKSGDQFDDRLSCHLDEARWAAEARAVTREAWAPRVI